MKRSILSIILLALIISLTVTVGSANLTTALAIENYLQLRSASVNYHGVDIDVDIRTGGNIPSEKGNNGFGYAVLTDVGDESVDNVLVAISDIGIKNNDKSTTKNDKMNTYVLDLTGDTSKACSGSDYEVTKSSSDNEGFDTSYPIDVEGNKISIDDVDTNDLASGTVKGIASFTAEAITNNGKIKQICIDIQDVLKQSEISISYNNDDDDDNGNGEDKDDHNDNDDTRRHDREQDNCDIGDAGFPFCDGRDDEKDSTDDDEDDCDIGDAGFPFCDGRDEEGEKDGDDSSGIDVDQDIDQSNECSGSSVCSNEGSNQVDVFEPENSVDDDRFDFDSNLDIDQSIERSNECNGEASCSNEANNEVDIGGEDSSNDDDSYVNGADLDIDQFIGQSNICGDEADCSNKGSNEANLWEDTSGNSDVDVSQSIEQRNTCGGSAICSNFASNVANIS
jgi:hypothetical protein